MKSLNCQISLTRCDGDYLKSATFLPEELARRVTSIHWGQHDSGTLEIPYSIAEQFRQSFTEELARVGFDESYMLTIEGKILERLIDRFNGEG